MYLAHDLVRHVSANGGIRLNRAYVTHAPALVREQVGLEEVPDGIWAVYCYDYLLGHLNERERHVHGVYVLSNP